MWSTKRLLRCFFVLFTQCLCFKEIQGSRNYIKCQDQGSIFRDSVLFLDVLLNSRLLCGTKCTEHSGICWSYAWNGNSKRCLLFYEMCSIDSPTEQEVTKWEHYKVQECSTYLQNGVLDAKQAFLPGLTVTGTCNEGYVPLLGSLNATCDSDYKTIMSDRCVQMLSDIAVGKPVTQSSTFEANVADHAVDGDRGTDLIENTCSHTDSKDFSPWWRVDLQAVYYIIKVRILNRGLDMFLIDQSDRLRDVTVAVGMTASSVNSVCGFFAGPGTLSQLVVLDCPPLTMARYVEISMVTEYLTLCEVDVFGASV